MAKLKDLQRQFQLKSLPRAGWERINGISNIESVASHCWGMSLLAIQYLPDELCLKKTLRIITLHDLPEVIVGDITPHDGIDVKKKRELEENAAQQLLSIADFAIWLDYAEQRSPEAQFVKILDKIDMAIQASIYDKNLNCAEFFISARRYFEHPLINEELRGVINEVVSYFEDK